MYTWYVPSVSFFKEKEEMVPSAFETNGYLHSVLTLFLKKKERETGG